MAGTLSWRRFEAIHARLIRMRGTA